MSEISLREILEEYKNLYEHSRRENDKYIQLTISMRDVIDSLKETIRDLQKDNHSLRTSLSLYSHRQISRDFPTNNNNNNENLREDLTRDLDNVLEEIEESRELNVVESEQENPENQENEDELIIFDDELLDIDDNDIEEAENIFNEIEIERQRMNNLSQNIIREFEQSNPNSNSHIHIELTTTNTENTEQIPTYSIPPHVRNVYLNHIENRTCAICLNNINFNETSQLTECGHLFHVRCLNRHRENQNNCPICRNNL